MININVDELLKLFNEDKSYSQIGKELGISANTVMRRLREVGANTDKIRTVEKLQGENNGNYRKGLDEKEMIRMYVEDKINLSDIAKKFNCDRGSVKRRLINNNIEIIRHPRKDKATDNQPVKTKLYRIYGDNAKRRGLSYNISIELFEKLISQRCFYCGTEPSQIMTTAYHSLVYNGIDRINSDKGYEEGNVVACCKYCNKMKSNMDSDIFLRQIKNIYNNLNHKED